MRDTLAPRHPAGRPLRLLATLVLTVLTVALLAALPTARASAGSSSISAPSPAEVESLLGGTPLEVLTPAQVAEALSQLPALQGLEPGPLKEALTKTVEELIGEGATLEQLLNGGEAAAILQEKLQQVLGLAGSQLESLLGGNPQQKLGEALESAGVSELIGKLLGGSPEPQVLIEKILGALSPERLQSLLGSLLAGEPFSKTTVEELARQLGTSVQTLAEALGRTPQELPATAMALTAPLANGERLGVLNGVGGVTLGVIKGTGETLGGTGGTIAGSLTPGTTSVAVQHSSAAPATSSGKSGVAGVKAGKLKVISHRVKGSRATVVVLVPAAGRLSAAARRLRSVSRETAQAERVTLHPSLSRSSASSLRRHHRRMRVSLRVSFKPVSGAASSATVPLVFR